MKSFNWKGILYDSTEHLQISEDGDRIKAESGIIGSFQGTSYAVTYKAEITRDWTVVTFHIIFKINSSIQEIIGVK